MTKDGIAALYLFRNHDPKKGNIGAGGDCISNREKLGSK